MDRYARIAGMTVFAIGIVVLVIVSGAAYNMFTAPSHELLAPRYETDSGHTAASLGDTLVLVIVRIALLFVIASAGSLIAARGIQMYSGRALADEEHSNGLPATESRSEEASDKSGD